MRKHIFLLLGVIVLYLIPSLVAQGIYGPSYGLWAGEDRWVPDASGGWVAHGAPATPVPDQPSVYVPILWHYLPILLPGALMALFMLTPLSRHLDRRSDDEEESDDDRQADPGQDTKKEPPEDDSQD